MSEKKKPNPLLRAWAAGVFDARISIPKNGHTLRMDTVDGELVTRFHEVVGVGKIHIDESTMNRGKRATNLPMSIFQTMSLDDSHSLCLFVAPLLSPKKFRQVTDLIARIERNPYWIRKNKGKGILSGTVRVPSAADELAPQSTAMDGDTVSPAE